MPTNKKPTIRELAERINVLSYNLNHFTKMLDSLGRGVQAYINFKGDEDEFKKYIENIQKKAKLKGNDEKTENKEG
jgi:hypothetical protein